MISLFFVFLDAGVDSLYGKRMLYSEDDIIDVFRIEALCELIWVVSFVIPGVDDFMISLNKDIPCFAFWSSCAFFVFGWQFVKERGS